MKAPIKLSKWVGLALLVSVVALGAGVARAEYGDLDAGGRAWTLPSFKFKFPCDSNPWLRWWGGQRGGMIQAPSDQVVKPKPAYLGPPVPEAKD